MRIKPGAESMTPERPGADFYLQITMRRRDLLKAQRAMDRAVWAAHKAGVTNVMIGHAMEVTEAAVRDRLKRIRRDKAKLAKDAEL